VYTCLVTTAGADQLGVWRIGRDGSSTLYAGLPEDSFPNDIFPDGDRLLVTDTRMGAVWEVREGYAAPWIVDPLLEGTGVAGFGFPAGANGIARLKDGSIVVSNIEKGSLVRIPVNPDGSAATPELLVEDPALFLSDGLAVDTRDNVYVAVIGQNTVVRIAPDGSIETLATATDDLDGPSDVTFGTSRGEQKDLFITNFAFLTPEQDRSPSLMKLGVGVPGAPIHR
jgi:sugar lactone lactonase YvrE